jgi:antitoxin HigA-1
MTNSTKLPPVHPGKTLERQFFQPLNLSREQLAQGLHIPTYQLQDLVEGKEKITPEIAYRLSCYFQIEPEVFLNLQQRYDLEV